MKKLALALVLFPMLAASASELAPSVEVLHDIWQTMPRQDPVWFCMNSAYRAETDAMERLEDTNVRVRYSRVMVMPDGLTFCHVKYFSSPNHEFVMETKTFAEKKCQTHAREIGAEKTVFWVDYTNRVKMPDGTKGCKVQFLKATKVGLR